MGAEYVSVNTHGRRPVTQRLDPLPAPGLCTGALVHAHGLTSQSSQEGLLGISDIFIFNY